MSEIEENNLEETEIEVHKLVKIKKVNGKEIVHEEEETKTNTKIETNSNKSEIKKNGREK